MEADLDIEEVLQPQPRELYGESLLTTEYLGVRALLGMHDKKENAIIYKFTL